MGLRFSGHFGGLLGLLNRQRADLGQVPGIWCLMSLIQTARAGWIASATLPTALPEGSCMRTEASSSQLKGVWKWPGGSDSGESDLYRHSKYSRSACTSCCVLSGSPCASRETIGLCARRCTT